MCGDKKHLKAEYQKLFERLTEILFRHDPIGMNLEATTSEYEPEARTILPRLRSERVDIDQVRNQLADLIAFASEGGFNSQTALA